MTPRVGSDTTGGERARIDLDWARTRLMTMDPHEAEQMRDILLDVVELLMRYVNDAAPAAPPPLSANPPAPSSNLAAVPPPREPECAGPFVSAFDCPKCDPRKAPAPGSEAKASVGPSGDTRGKSPSADTPAEPNAKREVPQAQRRTPAEIAARGITLWGSPSEAYFVHQEPSPYGEGIYRYVAYPAADAAALVEAAAREREAHDCATAIRALAKGGEGGGA